MMLHEQDYVFDADHALFAEVHMSQKTYDLVVMVKDKVSPVAASLAPSERAKLDFTPSNGPRHITRIRR